jgi:hypothetical protein
MPPEGGVHPSPRVTGRGLLEALARLEWPVRGTALLLVLVPMVDLLVAMGPIVLDDPGWRFAFASGLPGALLLPCVGTMVLALLAIVRPSRLARIFAMSAVVIGLGLGGFAVGTLTREVLWVTATGGTPGLAALWPPVLGLATVAAHAATGWSIVLE